MQGETHVPILVSPELLTTLYVGLGLFPTHEDSVKFIVALLELTAVADPMVGVDGFLPSLEVFPTIGLM